MNDILLLILSICAGGAGYLLVTFGILPSLRYLNLKHKILSDLIFYANAINAEGMNEEIKKRMLDRVEANRRHSAELVACYMGLPIWHKWWIKFRKHDPEKASKILMRLSNTYKDIDAANQIDKIKTFLGFNTDAV